MGVWQICVNLIRVRVGTRVRVRVRFELELDFEGFVSFFFALGDWVGVAVQS